MVDLPKIALPPTQTARSSWHTFGTAHVAEDKIVEAVEKTFDLRPGAIIRDLDLRRPIFEKTAAYGHFGREDADFTWEKTDRVEELKAACGL